MKIKNLLKIISLLLVILIVASCLKDKKESEINGFVIGTLFNKNDSIYVISDTLKGTNGAEIRYYFENEDTLKDVNTGSRVYFAFKLIKEREKLNYLVECLYFTTIPIRKIVYVEEDDIEIRDTLAGNPLSLINLSISHDFLNIGIQISYDNPDLHLLYVTKDALDQDTAKIDEVTLNLYHKDIEDKFSYFKKGLFYISVPIKELQDFYPENDTIYIRVLSKIENQSSSSMRIMYEKK